MVNSVDGENLVAAGEKKEELVPPFLLQIWLLMFGLVLIVRAILFCGVMPY
jgi:hypothetical protein